MLVDWRILELMTAKNWNRGWNKPADYQDRWATLTGERLKKLVTDLEE
jgi:hypothetical protein